MKRSISTYPGRVIGSLDGRLAVETLAMDGPYPLHDRDAQAIVASVRLRPSEEASRLAVLFTWEALQVLKTGFGLSNTLSDEALCVVLAEVAIGEYLDANGLPSFTPSGVSAHQIECPSDEVDSWRNRTRASDESVLAFIECVAFWSWKFERDSATLSHPDLVRLGVSLATMLRLVQLGTGESWSTVSEREQDIRYVPSQAFLRTRRALGAQGLPARLPEQLSAALQSPRYIGPRQHWSKAISFMSSESRDLANGASEAISALEGLARIVSKRPTDTLGEIIKQLRTEGKVDPAIAKGWEALWGFASNSPGVRHGAGSSGATLSQAEAEYVLDTSAAAMRMLLELDQ